MIEVSAGVGPTWTEYRLVGATRDGIAPAKEPVGKSPERYKLVEPGTIFYNPMRILLGSIAMIDDGEPAGITSPDYVVFRCREGQVHYRWLYFWLRSTDGAAFIRSLARGAVRERLLFRRLAKADLEMPTYPVQLRFSEAIGALNLLWAGVHRQVEALNALPAALLRRAFRGEL